MTAIKPIHSDHSGEWHRARFAEFAAAKARVGEPTPHMRVLMEMCQGISPEEKLWRTGVYAATYSLLSAEAIWREWDSIRVSEDPEGLTAWLRENWPGMHTRVPRRAVRTPEKMARCLLSWAGWMYEGHTWSASYDELWADVNRVDFFGRYISIRVLELLRRWGFLDAELQDIRAIGAHSPIRCLMLLWPQAIPDLATGQKADVDRVADITMQVLDNAYGVQVNPFVFAALLCEYRKSYEDRGDYPGHQTDEELGYLNSRYMDHWIDRGFDTTIWEARAAVSPLEVLGEHRGWSGDRKVCAAALRDHGVVWNDWDYDYAATVENGGIPVRWAEQASTR